MAESGRHDVVSPLTQPNILWPRALTGTLSAVLVALLVSCGSDGTAAAAASSGTNSTSTTTTSADSTTTTGSTTGSTATPDGVQKIRHVFIITLENESEAKTFGSGSNAAGAPYLASLAASSTAPGSFPAGVGAAFVPGYFGTSHVSLDNYLSMLSGQAPTMDTDNDCTTYQDVVQTGTAAYGQVIGTGCVYPASVKALPDQLTAAGFTWKGYEGQMGNDPAREAATCGHPALGSKDMTQTAEAPSIEVPKGDMYATRHNPFMYFHSVIDAPICQTNVVNLENNLQNDLKSVATTANFNFITPDLCDDGHDSPCADGRQGGLTSADAFLKQWVPIIVNSPAFKQDGLLIINFDESAYTIAVGTPSTSTGLLSVNLAFPGEFCCNEQPGPNLGPYPQVIQEASLPGSVLNALSPALASQVATAPLVSVNMIKNNYGGDQTGAVLISPFIKQGTTSSAQYNHYALLKSIEDIFGLPYLGYAGQTGLQRFGNDIFTNL